MIYALALIWIHFIADFVLQTDKMAINKSKSDAWLFLHVLVYSTPFAYFGLKFFLVTFLFHFITDYITSRVNSYLWRNEKRHWFFTMIGFDQAIHITTLFITYRFLFLQ